MDTILSEPLKQLRDELPPIFAGTALDRLTGDAYRWRTLQNERSRGEASAKMFMKHGERKTLIVRDPFLTHWQRKLSGVKK